ncbi:MAG TPA: folylpolyglutamate synthase/dihydrofolate synthase family protein [Terracidiphilus sp.]|jgi:dihydrofolate synthase/folylpolyglutamate synthase|nr:folylpolyglutamate synthase/dihydrofolate synthase family protein [Terracidiphilus sp.]
MSYAAAIDQLSAMTPELHTQPGQQRRKFSLTEIGALLAALGDPHRRFPCVLIAGTNGKGSTAATLASILQASGLRTGLYTSPHLVRPNERMRVNGIEISDDAFAALYFRVHDCGRQLVLNQKLEQLPSFFETLTAMAFVHYADEAVDCAVLEVGMGGRLDATNIVDPLLSIVTDISLDHTEWLGPTIAAIAREKAGILRSNGTLITLPQHPEANQVLGEVATELGTRAVSAVPYMPQSARTQTAFRAAATPSEAGVALERTVSGHNLSRADDTATKTETSAPDAHSYPVEVLGSTIQIDSPLHGQHQHRNIALAIAAAAELATQHHLHITPASIEQGIRSTYWPGRLEVIQLRASETSSTQQVVLDVAHNPAGAWALRAALRSDFGLGEAGAPPSTLIFGCLRDKPLAEMAQILFPLFDQVIFAPIHSPRATSAAELLAIAVTVGVPARAASSVEEALSWAESSPGSTKRREAPSARPATTVVAGSVYLVGEIRPILLARAHSA